MLFNSLEFLIFFPAVALLYFLLEHRYRWVLLLAASYIFYMGWNAAYALLLLASTAVTYFASVLIDASGKKSKKKLFLVMSIVINLGILFTFKYFEFFTSGLYAVFDALDIAYTPIKYSLVLPVGISFYIFQALGYSIDVYRGDVPVQKNFGKYALFVSFFPQLVAGPIERSSNLLPQFEEEHFFEREKASSGLRLMLWGYFKKIVIADTVCTAVNTVYNDITSFDGFAIVLATLLFTIQIFCDFSGYSDIARGCARIMGFELMRNFDHPYFSTSVQEFWRKWHISLSTWFKDYVYIPLGGNRKGEARRCLNLMITFLVSGLWHGADITFIVWGGVHGAFQVIGRRTQKLRNKISHTIKIDRLPHLQNIFKIIFTFLLVSFAWIFFRANTMSDAVYAVTHLADFRAIDVSYLFTVLKQIFGLRAEMYRLLATLPVFVAASVIDKYFSINKILSKTNQAVRFIIYVVIAVYILIFARAEMQDFIYFQF